MRAVVYVALCFILPLVTVGLTLGLQRWHITCK